jgi:hypothetical protein
MADGIGESLLEHKILGDGRADRDYRTNSALYRFSTVSESSDFLLKRNSDCQRFRSMLWLVLPRHSQAAACTISSELFYSRGDGYMSRNGSKDFITFRIKYR